MGLQNPKPGLHLVPEYQVSAWPYVTSSSVQGVVRLDFQYVTKFVIVKNTTTGSNTIRVGFTDNGVCGSNYIPLGPTESFAADIKVKQIFISGSAAETYTVFAGLTGIEAKEMGLLSGSMGYNGVG